MVTGSHRIGLRTMLPQSSFGDYGYRVPLALGQRTMALGIGTPGLGQSIRQRARAGAQVSKAKRALRRGGMFGRKGLFGRRAQRIGRQGRRASGAHYFWSRVVKAQRRYGLKRGWRIAVRNRGRWTSMGAMRFSRRKRARRR